MTCPNCGTANEQSFFCKNCGVLLSASTGGVNKVTYTRRISAYLLDQVLTLATLIIGWFIWFYFTAKDGQTPGMRLTGVYVVDVRAGQQARAGRVWLRELVLFAFAYFGFLFLIDCAWILFDKDRQAIHDKAMKTVVVYAADGLPDSMIPDVVHRPEPLPTGATAYTAVAPAQPPAGIKTEIKEVAEQLRELAKLHEEGILTDDEYEAKRKVLADQI